MYEENNNRLVVSSDDDIEIIISKNDKEVISTYINCFFINERIIKYLNNNISYLGYLVYDKNCFYRRKSNNKDNSIKSINYNENNIIIETIDKKYIIYKNNKMEVI